MKNDKADRELNDRIGQCIPNISEAKAGSGLSNAAQNIVNGNTVRATFNKHQAKIQDMAEKLKVEIKNCIKDMETSLGSKPENKSTAKWHMYNWGFSGDAEWYSGIEGKVKLALEIKEFFGKK